ncbi:MAG: acyl-CoA/acyl-ACP dehydrogenase [Mycobacteriaceae bacterium]|nr:acyl-CoA/acyl-ACP dehydrogenase [Mycobacteriaceae bacterium]
MRTANLLYSDTEEALRESVRRLLAERCPLESVAKMYDAPPPDFSGVWQMLASDLGLAGLLIPEALDGAGASAREAAVVLEEMGRAVAPVPFLSSSVLATVALLTVGETEILMELASGAATAALAIPLSAAPGDPVCGVSIEASRLVGQVRNVADVGGADVLVVPAMGPHGLELHVVRPTADGVQVSPVLALDMTRPLADVRFSHAVSVRIDGGSDQAAGALCQALRTGAALLASEQLGIAQWCFDTTLNYVKQRKQFGRAIGSYQAIKHRLADLWLDVSSAAVAARYAADTCARGDEDASVAAAMAQAFCSDVAVHVAEECVQLHGGTGMTWEYPVHLYLKRAKSDQLALGTPYRHRAWLAELVHLPTS